MDEFFLESKNVGGKTLVSTLKAPLKLRKYLKSTELFVQYDKEITENESILNIPLTSLVLPLAWLTDTNIRVETLDKRYYETMYMLKEEMNKIFPYKPFKTEIITDNILKNSVKTKGSALCFSGGVDSMYSLITNLEKKPSLVMVWGVDRHIYPEHAEHWKQLESIYTNFAHRIGLDFNMIKTNISNILDDKRIDHQYHKALCSGMFRMKLIHSLTTIPLLAPFSIDRFNECIFAASIYPGFPYDIWRIGSIPSTDEKIVWADLKTKHDGFIPRIEKVKTITDYIKNNKELTLKVCFKPKLNCSSCSKCYRTIISLLLYGVDPNACGFKVDEKTFENMKKHFKKPPQNAIVIPHFLKPMQTCIGEENLDIIPGSADFLKWYKNIDFDAVTKTTWKYRKIYDKLPYPIASGYDLALKKLGINIHPNSYIEANTEKNMKQYKI